MQGKKSIHKVAQEKIEDCFITGNTNGLSRIFEEARLEIKAGHYVGVYVMGSEQKQLFMKAEDLEEWINRTIARFEKL